MVADTAHQRRTDMGKIIISENVTLDGVVQDPAGGEGFRHGGWIGRIGDRGREEAARVALDEAPPRRIAVCLEVTPEQAFASALDWPGWCRAGRDEGAALEALASYAGRYAPVAERAGVSFPSAVAFEVVERVPGGPATAFAAPNAAARSRR